MLSIKSPTTAAPCRDATQKSECSASLPTVKAIWKCCGALSQDQRKAIILNVRNEHGRLVMPSYDALNNFINGIDPEALAKELNQWLAVHQDKLPQNSRP